MKVQPTAATALRGLGLGLGLALLVLLTLPLLSLTASVSLEELRVGLQSPLFAPALWLSARTTAASLLVSVVAGTPLSWWLARSSSRAARVLGLMVELPIVIPPAVVGVALLTTFGRQGLLGPLLSSLDIDLPFTSTAVLTAQIVVSAPFYVKGATSALREVPLDLLIVARTLGASSTNAFLRVAVPFALPGLVASASLAWARSLGEFGATLLFAGNRTGTTQTLPLSIFTALESDVRVATVLSLLLLGLGGTLLVALRLAPRAWARLGRTEGSATARSRQKR